MLREYFVAVLILSGSLFMLLGGLGVIRMPDLFLRMSATSKAATLGAGLVLLGTAIFFNDFAITTRVIAIIVFLLLTTPVAAHMIARAAYFDGVPLWSGTLMDELRGHYRTSDHTLIVEPEPSNEFDIPQVDEGDDFTT